MKNLPLRILRYNTGNDKHVFLNFKDDFDIVIFNATIVAHSGSAIADLVSIHKNYYIVDPQTHIFQHDVSLLQPYKAIGHHLKKSIEKYFDYLPKEITKITINETRPIHPQEIESEIPKLVEKVVAFQTECVNTFIKNKDYEDYLDYVDKKPKPFLVIAPYFMLKKEYSNEENYMWLDINRLCLQETIDKYSNNYDIASQLVLDKDVLKNMEILDRIISTYDRNGFDYLFLWIDDFSTFSSSDENKKSFRELISKLNRINKKIIMTYGGYDSILLCNSQSKYRLYGVAQSIGYGESRPITPVGGGLPINKYYFYPLHKRMKFAEVAEILNRKGYFSESEAEKIRIDNYFEKICNCKQCELIIRNSIENFNTYNDSIPFEINSRYGIISKNRPTTDATFISAMHFMYCKVKEWQNIKKKSFDELCQELLINYRNYATSGDRFDIEQWNEIYG